MHGDMASNRALLSDLLAGAASVKFAELAVLVPFPYLALCQSQLTDSVIAWGAQNVNAAPSGALTGEVSTKMLQDFACRYVIVGHSERRQYFGESSQVVAEKALAACEAGIRPIVCIGETLAQREAGQMQSVLQEQLAPLLELPHNAWEQLVMAYEPVWAIGTGVCATAQQVDEVHGWLRQQLVRWLGDVAETVRLLYGGSVKPENAAELLCLKEVDGALVGGASLKADSFLTIGDICNQSS